jgi:hypothetical protein
LQPAAHLTACIGSTVSQVGGLKPGDLTIDDNSAEKSKVQMVYIVFFLYHSYLGINFTARDSWSDACKASP